MLLKIIVNRMCETFALAQSLINYQTVNEQNQYGLIFTSKIRLSSRYDNSEIPPKNVRVSFFSLESFNKFQVSDDQSLNNELWTIRDNFV